MIQKPMNLSAFVSERLETSTTRRKLSELQILNPIMMNSKMDISGQTGKKSKNLPYPAPIENGSKRFLRMEDELGCGSLTEGSWIAVGFDFAITTHSLSLREGQNGRRGNPLSLKLERVTCPPVVRDQSFVPYDPQKQSESFLSRLCNKCTRD